MRRVEGLQNPTAKGKQIPHSPKLLQFDNGGKRCDGGAGGLSKGETAGKDGLPGATGQRDPGKGKAAAPKGRTSRGRQPSGAPGLPRQVSRGARLQEKTKGRRIHGRT